MPTCPWIAFALVASACGHPAAPAALRALPPLLLASRAATGGDAWDRVQAIDSRATLAVGGMSGTSAILEDVPSGRSRSEVTLGSIHQAEGWDGTTSWRQTPGGEIIRRDAPPAIALAQTQAWLTRRGYYRPTGAAYRDAGVREEAGARYQVIEASPEGGAPIALWFDASQHLARTIEQIGGQLVTTTLSDYRAVGEVEVPFHVTVDEGDPRNKLEMRVTSAAPVASPAVVAFAAPAVDVDRIAFTAGTRTDLPFELINNHIYIRAAIDGAPVRMLVDTGGLNMLTPAAARRLALATDGAMAASGVGEAKAEMGLAHARQLTVGGVTLAHPVFYVIDIGKLADVEGEAFDGLVGFELFSRLRVRIDYPARSLALIAPTVFAPPAGAIAVPFEMIDRTPIVQGAIDGIPGRFWVDTGARLALTTSSKFTRDHDLAARYHPAFEAVTGWGVGGPTRSAPVRFREVQIGGAIVRDVVGDLFTGAKGAFADPNAAANLGGGLLRRFVVTFDYAAKIMYLEPRPDGARDTYDRSGLFLVQDGDALRVASAVGPAVAAGIRADDRITAIDGAPIASRTLAAWRDQLRDRPPGTQVRLRVARAGDVVLTLAELVP